MTRLRHGKKLELVPSTFTLGKSICVQLDQIPDAFRIQAKDRLRARCGGEGRLALLNLFASPERGQFLSSPSMGRVVSLMEFQSIVNAWGGVAPQNIR